MPVTPITSKSQFDEITKSGKLVVIDFYADWCGPCRAMSPKVEEFSGRFTNAEFYKVDTDVQTDVAQELGIRSIPAFFVFKDGEKVDNLSGANPSALEAMIQRHIA